MARFGVYSNPSGQGFLDGETMGREFLAGVDRIRNESDE